MRYKSFEELARAKGMAPRPRRREQPDPDRKRPVPSELDRDKLADDLLAVWAD